MNQSTQNKLLGDYIVNLGPEAKNIVKEMADYRYAPRPEGEKPPKGFPKDLERRIIQVLTIALNNRLNYIDNDV